ncbi:MAG: type IV secretory system conjugative DNA transfer family protein [Pseudomonadota bacterium]
MRKKLVLATIITVSLLSACTRYVPLQNYDTTNLADLQKIEAPPSYNNEEAGSPTNNQIRYKALEEIAMGIGAQGGLASASQSIDNNLIKDKNQLDALFNFNGMMLSHGVIPPVLVQGDNSLNLADPDTIRISDKTYKIVRQARFVTTPPNWRDYLWQSYEKPELPNKTLLPTNPDERRIWRRAIKLGWDKGTQQAYDIFQQNLATLKRDYQGMILYRRLLEEHIVSPPYVAKTEFGVTGNGDELRVNDEMLRITEHPQLQTNSKRWRAIVVRPDAG